jgi:hypothetical protein
MLGHAGYMHKTNALMTSMGHVSTGPASPPLSPATSCPGVPALLLLK